MVWKLAVGVGYKEVISHLYTTEYRPFNKQVMLRISIH